MKEEGASINRLVDAFKGVFTAAISFADELTQAASFTLDNVGRNIVNFTLRSN